MPRPGIVRAFVWYAAVATIALGTAGLIVDLDRPQAAGGRPELTVHGDRIVADRLVRAREEAQPLPAETDALSAAATNAFAALAAEDPSLAGERIVAGEARLERVATAADALRAWRSDVTAALGTARISDAARARLAAVDDAISAADALRADWQAFVARVQEVAAAMEESPDRADAILDGASQALVEDLVALDRARGRIAAAVAALD